MSFIPTRRTLKPWERRNRDAQLAADRIPVVRRDTYATAKCATCGCERSEHMFGCEECACRHCTKFVEIKEAA